MTDFEYLDLNRSDMIVILSALLTVKSALPDDLQDQSESVQLKAARLLHLIERFRIALKVPDEIMEAFADMAGGDTPTRN